jgi:hypothetical protein
VNRQQHSPSVFALRRRILANLRRPAMPPGRQGIDVLSMFEELRQPRALDDEEQQLRETGRRG